MASTLRSLTVWFRARTGDFKRKVLGARASMSGFSKTARSMQSGLSRLRSLLLGGLGFVVLTRGIRAATAAWNDYERSLSKVNTFLKTTGGLVGFTRMELVKFSRELQATTGVMDTKFLDTMAILGTFVRITGDEFKLATRAAGDLAQMFSGDMSKAAVQLGKALSDADRGLTALRRVGVLFTNVEVARAKKLFDLGRMKEYQQLILSVVLGLNGVRDAMKDFRQTGAGAMQDLTSQWEVWKRQIGEQVQPLVVALGETIGALGPSGTAVGKAMVGAFESVALAIAKVVRMIQIAVAGMKVIFATALGGLGLVVKAAERIDKLLPGKQRFSGNLRAFGKAGPERALPEGVRGEERVGVDALSTQLFKARRDILAGAHADFDKIMFGENAEDDVKKFFRRVRGLGEQFKKEREKATPIFTGSRFFRNEFEQVEKAFIALQATGVKVTEELQSPLEKYEARLGVLGDLVEVQAITWETYGRGIRKAREELDKTFKGKTVQSLKTQLAGAVEVGANFRGSGAAFRNANPIVTLAKEGIALDKVRNAKLAAIEKASLKKPPVSNL